MAEKYAFLSEEWIAQARRIREDYTDGAVGDDRRIRMNQVITEVPFGEGTIRAHVDTSTGEMHMDVGHVEDAEVTVTLDYDTARAIFVDPQTAIQHFMAGKIKVQGDLTKLVTLVQTTPDASATDAQRRIVDITE